MIDIIDEEEKLLDKEAERRARNFTDEEREARKRQHWLDRHLYDLLDPAFFAKKLLSFNPFKYQLSVLRDARKRVIMKSGRQIGKTTITSIKALHYAYTNSGKTVLVVAPTQRQSSHLFNKIRDFILSNEFIKKSMVRSTLTMIEFANGSRIYSLPSGHDGSGIRGYTADLLIIDEAAFVPDAVYPAILPMLATTKGQMLLLSTPFGKRGFFYEAWRDWDNKIYGKYDFPSSISPLIDKQFLSDQRKRLTDIEYKTEYEAIFVDEAGAYFPRALVEGCIRDYEYINEGHRDKTYLVGVDWAKYQDSTVIMVVERGEQFHKLVHKKEYTPPINYETPVRYMVEQVNKRFNIARVSSDRGAGERQIEEMRSCGLPVFAVTFSAPTKIDLYQNLKMLMEMGHIHIPHDKKLISQLCDFEYKLSDYGNLLFPKKGGHDDLVDALALACFNLRRPYRPIYLEGKTKRL